MTQPTSEDHARLNEWILFPPVHLTEDEAFKRGADIARLFTSFDTSTPSLANQFLLMLMLHWAEHARDLIFKARFYDFRKESTS